MQFELNKEYIDHLFSLIENNKKEEVEAMMKELHPADIKEIYDVINIEQARYIHLLLDNEQASDVLIELEEPDRKRFLKILPGELIAKQYINHMDSDDAADVIGELSEEVREEVLFHLEDIEQASHILDLLGYEEDTAGGLMAKELIVVNENWNIATCLQEMRKQADVVDEVYFVYVVDNHQVLKGIVSLKKMLLSSEKTIVKDILQTDVVSVKATTPSEEVANIMDKYDLVAMPVVDSLGRLIGRITIDDVVDFIREEAEKNYNMVSGISTDITPSSGVWNLTRARFPWLLIGLIGGIFGAQIIGVFEYDIGMYPEMAFFLPLIAAMGGNAGVQSSAIMVQALAGQTLGLENHFKKLLRELGIAGLNGFVLSILLLAYNLIISSSLALTLSVSTALFSVILFASVFGTFIPLFLHKMKIDPALATGPFITTVNDISGILIYLFVGRVLFAFFQM